MATSPSQRAIWHAQAALDGYQAARGPGLETDWPYWAGYLCHSLKQLLGTAELREATARELRKTQAALAAVACALPAAQIEKSDLTPRGGSPGARHPPRSPPGRRRGGPVGTGREATPRRPGGWRGVRALVYAVLSLSAGAALRGAAR